MRVHNHLLGRHGKISRIDPTKIALEKAQPSVPEESVAPKQVQVVVSEPITEPVVVQPEPESVEPESVMEAHVPGPVEPEPEAQPKVDIQHLLGLSSSAFKDEIHSGKYDSLLPEILKAEEEGKNRKGYKAKVEERIASKAS